MKLALLTLSTVVIDAKTFPTNDNIGHSIEFGEEVEEKHKFLRLWSHVESKWMTFWLRDKFLNWQ